MIDTISKGIMNIVSLTKDLSTMKTDRRRETLNSIVSVRTAAAETRAYLADQKKDPRASCRDRDHEIMSHWLNAGSAIYNIDQKLGDKCMMKADGWSDDRLWSSEKYKHVALDLDSIVEHCDKILKEA